MSSVSVKRLFSNAGALFLLQLANYILPFVLIPYLTRTLGVSLYGVVAFGLSLVQLACVLTDFGFNLSATHKIASNQEDRGAIRRIVAAVSVCKLFLLLPVIGGIFFFLNIQFEEYGRYSTFFWLLLIPIVGQTFQPVWLFHGIERMGFITLPILVARSCYVLLTVLWVDSPNDYFEVAIAFGISQSLGAVIAIGLSLYLGYGPVWPGWRYVLKTFMESTEYFWSRAAVATYTAGGAFFIGLASGPVSVAYYSAAEQMYRGAMALFQPLSQALFPHMTRTKDVFLFFRILKFIIVFSIIGLIFGLLSGKFFLTLIFGSDFVASYPILVVFLFIFCIAAPSVLCGYPFLGAFGDSRSANASVIFGGMLQMALLFILWQMNWISGFMVAMTVMVVEVFVLVYRGVKVRRILIENYSKC